MCETSACGASTPTPAAVDDGADTSIVVHPVAHCPNRACPVRTCPVEELGVRIACRRAAEAQSKTDDVLSTLKEFMKRACFRRMSGPRCNLETFGGDRKGLGRRTVNVDGSERPPVLNRYE
jgi:hypothetical protein